MRQTENMLIIGVGNAMRRDDGVGPYVARMLSDAAGVRVIELSGEGTELMEAWEGENVVTVIDAARSGATPGTVIRLDMQAETAPTGFFHYSTHAFGVAEAIELSRTLGSLPPALTVYGIEGEDFGSGEGLSPAVHAAAQEVCRRIRGEVLKETVG